MGAQKTALVLPLMLALLIPSVANAEFTRSYKSSDPSINYTHFFLTVYSPDNNQTCKSTMLLNFTVEWTDYPTFAGFPSPPAPVMKGLYSYAIDNNPAVNVASNQSSTDQFDLRGFKVNPTFSYLLDVSNLTNGYHKIVITVGLTHSQSYIARYINTDTPIQFFVQNPTPTSEVPPTSEDWNEVARFTGSGTTNYFTCEHAEWRIRWEYKPEIFHFLFGVYVYEQGEDVFFIEAITKSGNEQPNGVTYIHDQKGTFYLDITTANIDKFTIIIEQDLNSIPEFPSWAILPLVLTITLFSVVVKRKLYTVKVS